MINEELVSDAETLTVNMTSCRLQQEVDRRLRSETAILTVVFPAVSHKVWDDYLSEFRLQDRKILGRITALYALCNVDVVIVDFKQSIGAASLAAAEFNWQLHPSVTIHGMHATDETGLFIDALHEIWGSIKLCKTYLDLLNFR